jgi:hypothetical protein
MEGFMTTPITDSVLQAERRARSYWDIDGLAVIIQAVAVLLAGLWLWYMNASGAWGRRQSDLAAMVCIVAVVLDTIRKPGIILWFKRKITYPRTGYVAPPAPQLSSPLDRGFKFSDFEVFCLLIVLWGVALWAQTALVCAAIGVATGLSLWWNPARGKSAYLDLFGICCSGMVAAFAVSALHRVVHLERFAYTLTALGALGLIKGIITLLRYVRRNPVAQS